MIEGRCWQSSNANHTPPLPPLRSYLLFMFPDQNCECIYPLRVTCSTNLIPRLTVFCEQYASRTSSLFISLHCPVGPVSLGSQHLVLADIHSMGMGGQVSQQHKTTRNTIVPYICLHVLRREKGKF